MLKLNAVQTAKAITELGYPMTTKAIRHLIQRGKIATTKEPVKEGSAQLQHVISIEDVYKLYAQRTNPVKAEVSVPVEAMEQLKQLKEVNR